MSGKHLILEFLKHGSAAHRSARRSIRNIMRVTFLALATALFFTVGCEQRHTKYEQKGASMEPTITHESAVTVDHQAYRDQKPERLDIVAFVPPINEESVFVFRVIGLPGESVALDEHGVQIDGTKVGLPKGVHHEPAKSDLAVSETYNNVKLKNGEYYVMGDNGRNSNDSRYYGPIKESAIIGKVTEIEQDAGGKRE